MANLHFKDVQTPEKKSKRFLNKAKRILFSVAFCEDDQKVALVKSTDRKVIRTNGMGKGTSSKYLLCFWAVTIAIDVSKTAHYWI